MKKTLLLISFLGISSFAWVQDEKDKQSTTGNANAYRQGVWRTPLKTPIRYNSYNQEYNNVEAGEGNSLRIHLETDYFVEDYWAVGLRYAGEFGGFRVAAGNNEEKERNWEADLRITYGRPINNNLYWFTRANVGIGREKFIDITGSTTVEDETKIFQYGITAGLSARIGQTNNFLEPFVGYEVKKKDYDNFEEKLSNLRVGLKFSAYNECDEMDCYSDGDCRHPRSLYEQGHWFLNAPTMATMNLGNYEVTYDNSPTNNYKGNYNTGNVSVDANYYIIDKVAIGLWAQYRGIKDKEDDGGYERTDTRFLLGPKITAHVPVNNCWSNFYAQIGASFGTEKTEIKSGSFTSESKDGVKSFQGGIGYLFHFTKNVALSPGIYYQTIKYDDKDSDNEATQDGLIAELRMRFSF